MTRQQRNAIARRKAYERRRNIARRNKPQARGFLERLPVSRSAQRPGNWLEYWVRQAMRNEQGGSLTDALLLTALAGLLALLMYWLTGCTPY